jgi:hypothetical protein
MKKNNTLLFTKIIYLLVIIGTIITMIVVYNNIDNNIATKFVIGYAVLIIFFLLYVPIITLINARRFKWTYIKKMLNEAIFFFVIIFIFNCVFDYIFKRSCIDIVNACINSFCISFSGAFIDVTFLKKGGELE